MPMFGKASFQQEQGAEFNRPNQQDHRENRHRGPPGTATMTGRSVIQAPTFNPLPAFLKRGSKSAKAGNGAVRKSALQIALEAGGKSQYASYNSSNNANDGRNNRIPRHELSDDAEQRRRDSTSSGVPPSWDVREPVAEPPPTNSSPSKGRRPPSVRQRHGSLGVINPRRRVSDAASCGSVSSTSTRMQAAGEAADSSNGNSPGSCGHTSRGSSNDNGQADHSFTSARRSSTRAASSPSGSPYLEPACQRSSGIRRGYSRSSTAADEDRYRRGADLRGGDKTPRQGVCGGSRSGGAVCRDSREQSRGSGSARGQAPPSTAPSAIALDRLPSIDRRLSFSDNDDCSEDTKKTQHREADRWGGRDRSTVSLTLGGPYHHHDHTASEKRAPTRAGAPAVGGEEGCRNGPETGMPTSEGRQDQNTGSGSGNPGVGGALASKSSRPSGESNMGSESRSGGGGAGTTPARGAAGVRRASSCLVGLQNLGNTCFMNACLQCLLHTDLLLQFFRRGIHEQQLCRKSPTQGALAIAFGELVRQMESSPAHSSVSPAQEFLRFFLDGLAEDLNRRRSGPQPGGGCKGAGVSPIAQVPAAISDEALARLSADQQAARAWTFHLARNDSEVTSMFCGQLQSRIFCLTCGNVSYCFDPFFDLSVPLTSFGRRAGTASKNFNISGGVGGGVRSEGGHASTSGVSAAGGQPTPACTLEDCLQAFTKEESLDGDNRPICSGCRKRRKSEKSLAVHRFPPVLVIHLKRFQYDSSSREKIQTTVDFPISGLDLSPYSTTSAFLSSSRAGQGQLHRGAENGASAESGGNMSGELRDSTADAGSRRGRERELYSRDSHRKRSSLLSPLYELYGVCDHTGGLEGGHYIAHCRHNDPSSGGTNPSPSDGAEWYTFDDARVSRVNPARIGGSAAYVLFYRLMQREDENG